jgi:hypothetical protein
MAVVKQNYTVSAPWTSAQLADAFRDAFIDAGLMQSWHDSFTTQSTVGGVTETIQHRVMRIISVPGKTYGTIYHWFVFRASGRTEYSMAHQWDVNTHQPTGIPGLDFCRQTYARLEDGVQGMSHRAFGTHVTSTTTTLTRYSSAVRANFSMFLLKGGNDYFAFMFWPPGAQPQPFVDLNVNTCGGLICPCVSGNRFSSSDAGFSVDIAFVHTPLFRNNIFNYGGSAEEGFNIPANDQQYAYVNFGMTATGVCYAGYDKTSQYYNAASSMGVLPGSYAVGGGSTLGWGIRNRFDSNQSPNGLKIALPAELNAANRNRSSDSTPVFSDLPYSLYFLDRMPTDFGIVWHFTNSSMEVQDIFQVTPGQEEWEILVHGNNPSPLHPSPLVIARVI